MSSNIGNMKFLDSYQLMGSSLEQLVKCLYNKQDMFKHLHFIQQAYPKHDEIQCKKGLYPYEWFDSLNKAD